MWLAGQTARAAIDPHFTPITLFRTSKTMLHLRIGPLDEKNQLPVNVVAARKGEAPKGLALDTARADLPELNRRAATPEDRQITARLKLLLGGGEAMPTNYSPATNGLGKIDPLPVGTCTLWHGAGFGFLYQLTGEVNNAGSLKPSDLKELSATQTSTQNAVGVNGLATRSLHYTCRKIPSWSRRTEPLYLSPQS
jgi:hypothetical protein